MKQEMTIDIDPVITWVTKSSKDSTKLYISWNAVYASPAKFVRKRLVDALKNYLTPYFKHLQPFNGPVQLEFTYTSGKKTFDLDNKMIWAKMAQDEMRRLGVLKEDNVKYVTKVSMEYQYRDLKEDALGIKIIYSK